jgi:hypothetical protein
MNKDARHDTPDRTIIMRILSLTIDQSARMVMKSMDWVSLAVLGDTNDRDPGQLYRLREDSKYSKCGDWIETTLFLRNLGLSRKFFDDG